LILRRLWLPLLLTAGAIGFTGRVPAVREAGSAQAPSGVAIDLPAAYVITSPVSRALDAFTLLSTAQSIAALLTAALIVVAWFAFAQRKRGVSRWILRVMAIIIVTGVFLAAVALLPRPMAALRVEDPDIIVVDFHSHTGTSHDVRKSFGAEENREWHASGGFNAAWITDHVKFDAAVAARSGNPPRAGDGVSLLTGVEGRYHRIMSTIMLGLDERDSALLNRRGNLLPGTPARGRAPYTIVALPNRNLDSVTAESLDSLPRFAAIELIDAAPRGLAQFDREEGRIRALAAARGLTLVAASNNHGYGRAVAAWNLLPLPGWRNLSHLQLAEAIEDRLRNSPPTIVMRTRPRTHNASVVFTLPVMFSQILGSLTIAERFFWLVWIWGITLSLRIFRRRRVTA
jgi:hypothetical protein